MPTLPPGGLRSWFIETGLKSDGTDIPGAGLAFVGVSGSAVWRRKAAASTILVDRIRPLVKTGERYVSLRREPICGGVTFGALL